MTLQELCDLVDEQLTIIYYPNQNNRWCASFKYGEVQENNKFLASAYGDGKTPDEAIENYLQRIRGKTIVFHARQPEARQEFVIPESCQYKTGGKT